MYPYIIALRYCHFDIVLLVKERIISYSIVRGCGYHRPFSHASLSTIMFIGERSSSLVLRVVERSHSVVCSFVYLAPRARPPLPTGHTVADRTHLYRRYTPLPTGYTVANGTHRYPRDAPLPTGHTVADGTSVIDSTLFFFFAFIATLTILGTSMVPYAFSNTVRTKNNSSTFMISYMIAVFNGDTKTLLIALWHCFYFYFFSGLSS